MSQISYHLTDLKPTLLFPVETEDKCEIILCRSYQAQASQYRIVMQKGFI